MKASWKRSAGAWLVVLVISGAGVWAWQRETIMLWYHSWKIQRATPDQLSGLALKLEPYGMRGVETLIQQWQSPEETVAQNASQVLSKVLMMWGPDDGRQAAALECMAKECAQFSVAGQRECLSFVVQLMKEGRLGGEAGQVLESLASKAGLSEETMLTMLEALTALFKQEQHASDALISKAKNLIKAGLQEKQVTVRLAAIRLAVTPALQAHGQLTVLVTGAVPDSSEEVRQLALLALGEHESLLSTDDLCRFLHDRNEEVRSIAERALKVRGLNEKQLKMARMLHDPQASERAELPALVFASQDIDTVQWMERLCKDPSPAVRAASARAMGKQGDQRLQSLLQQLSEKDQDESVQQIARFYGAAPRQ